MPKQSLIVRAARLGASGAVVALACAVLGACDGPDAGAEPEISAELEQRPLADGLQAGIGEAPDLGRLDRARSPEDDVTERVERRFLVAQIDHLIEAVAIGDTCVERADHEELRAFCERMIDVQEAEIGEMHTWLAKDFGVEHEAVLGVEARKNLAALDALDGAELEQELLGDLLRHDARGAARADTCSLMARHAGLLESCDAQARELTGQVDQLETWLREWYLGC
jgi:hypothetical protein